MSFEKFLNDFIITINLPDELINYFSNLLNINEYTKQIKIKLIEKNKFCIFKYETNDLLFKIFNYILKKNFSNNDKNIILKENYFNKDNKNKIKNFIKCNLLNIYYYYSYYNNINLTNEEIFNQINNFKNIINKKFSYEYLNNYSHYINAIGLFLPLFNLLIDYIENNKLYFNKEIELNFISSNEKINLSINLNQLNKWFCYYQLKHPNLTDDFNFSTEFKTNETIKLTNTLLNKIIINEEKNNFNKQLQDIRICQKADIITKYEENLYNIIQKEKELLNIQNDLNKLKEKYLKLKSKLENIDKDFI